MGFPINGQQVYTFNGSSTQTLDYQCRTDKTTTDVRLIDVEYFNAFGVSAFFNVLAATGEEVWGDNEDWEDAGAAGWGWVVVVVLSALGVVLGGVYLVRRNKTGPNGSYANCLDDSTSEMIQLNGENAGAVNSHSEGEGAGVVSTRQVASSSTIRLPLGSSSTVRSSHEDV
jgi:hypothetical protein